MKLTEFRFPHTCKLYRRKCETSFDDGVEEIVYKGKCSKYGATTMRTFRTDNVIKSDYAVDIPEPIDDVFGGLLLDVTDDNGTLTECQVSDVQTYKYGVYKKRKPLIGTTIYFNVTKE